MSSLADLKETKGYLKLKEEVLGRTILSSTPRFQDSQHMKVLRLSDLHTGRLYTPGNIPLEPESIPGP